MDAVVNILLPRGVLAGLWPAWKRLVLPEILETTSRESYCDTAQHPGLASTRCPRSSPFGLASVVVVLTVDVDVGPASLPGREGNGPSDRPFIVAFLPRTLDSKDGSFRRPRTAPLFSPFRGGAPWSSPINDTEGLPPSPRKQGRRRRNSPALPTYERGRKTMGHSTGLGPPRNAKFFIAASAPEHRDYRLVDSGHLPAGERPMSGSRIFGGLFGFHLRWQEYSALGETRGELAPDSPQRSVGEFRKRGKTPPVPTIGCAQAPDDN